MLFLKRLFGSTKLQTEGRAVFAQLGAQARLPILYTAYGVPDTLDGRFEMLCLHVYPLFHRLKGQGAEAEALSQTTYDAMFADLGVGRRIKTMTEALNGRIHAFDRAFAAGDAELREAVRRNVYGTAAPSEDQVRAMADYLRHIREALLASSLADLCAGRLSLPEPAPPALESTHATG